MTRPSGKNVSKTLTFNAADFSASTDRCDVRIGKNRFQGDLAHYTIHVELEEDITCTVEIKRTTSSWRPGTGIRHYGNKGDMGWFVAVPDGDTQVTLQQAGKTEALPGKAYHDHNWGDVPMAALIHDWYWGRGRASDYTFVIANVRAEQPLGYELANDFLLEKNGHIVAEDGQFMKVEERAVRTDTETGKPYGNELVFTYRRDTQHYRITFHVDAIIERRRFHDTNDGSYLRFTGNAMVEQIVDGKVADRQEARAIWEQMYFGRILN